MNNLDRFVMHGYRIEALLITPERLLSQHWYAGPNSQQFLQHWHEYSASAHFFVHLKDYLHWTLLLSCGGTVVDAGAVLLRPLPDNQFAGLDVADFSGDCSWCWNEGEYTSLTDEVFDDPSVPYLSFPRSRGKRSVMFHIGSGIVRLQPGHKFLYNALETFFSTANYCPQCVLCTGPIAISLAFQASPDVAVTLLPWHYIYPFGVSNLATAFQAERNSTAVAYQLLDKSLAVYMFGSASAAVVEKGSVVDVLTRFLRLDERKYQPELQFPPLYVDASFKSGEFVGRDAIRIAAPARIDWHSVVISARLGKLNFGFFEGTLKTVNWYLAMLRYNCPPNSNYWQDEIEIHYSTNASSIMQRIPVVVFHRAVTLLSKTMARERLVKRLIDSFRSQYAGTKVIVADDGGGMDTKWCHASDGCIWLSMQSDAGLSLARNTLVDASDTPFVFLADDDFEVTFDSRIDVLLEHAIIHEADIVAGKIPYDRRLWGIDFAGLLQVGRDQLELLPGAHQQLGACQRVDFVPNVFIATRSALQRIRWDPELKLGEHEDFFLRAKREHVRVLTCETIGLKHNQQQWYGWEQRNTDYAKKRLRVFAFFDMALRKHGLKRLLSFGNVMHELKD
eukprot:TRINITY_DN3598_c0_g1_i1.p1 TRINITY_DN3598_c0_g1~~TRINITY_DN3598_c0_g1_i1.p1  ORF type:complete len:619 (+),score=80.98 TRINITY_DN3598_c0_g1_i1:419-2275(+)